jgi:predicted nucleotidyltransferase
MSVTPDQAAATMKRRAQERRDLALRRREVILARLPEAKRLLCDVYGVRRVVLFGSMAQGDPSPESDVDLAVWGLAPGVYFAAVADVGAALGCSVDLVRIEEAPPSLTDRIAQEGQTL